MKIDITRQPPTDIFRDRGKYLRIFMALLSLAICGVLLMLYGFVSDTPQSDTLEKVSLSLLVGPAVLFGYFGGKLRAYIGLNPAQKKILADLRRQHAAISTYCGLVAEEGRQPILAEYHACRDWAEDESNKRKQAEKSKPPPAA